MDSNGLAQQVADIQAQLQQLQQAIAPLPQTENQSMHLNHLFENLLSRLQTLEKLDLPLQSEQTARASEEKWRALSACSPVGIFTCDANGRVTYTNPRCHEIGDFTLEASLGEGFATVIHAEDRDRIVSQWFAQAKAGQPYADEFRVVDREGGVRWVRVQTAPIVFNDRTLMGHTGTVEDITQQKQAQQTLCDADKRKDEFLAILAHELRNPLAPLRTGVQVLKMQAPLSPS